MATNSALSAIAISTDSGATFQDINAVGSATVSLNRPALDITPIGSPVNTYIAGTQNTTGSLDLFFDNDDTQHAGMLTDINSANVARVFRLTFETGETIAGSAFVTAYDITAQAGSVVRATISLQFTGTITIVHTA